MPCWKHRVKRNFHQCHTSSYTEFQQEDETNFHSQFVGSVCNRHKIQCKIEEYHEIVWALKLRRMQMSAWERTQLYV